MPQPTPPLLIDVLPDLTEELHSDLDDAPELAIQLDTMRIVTPCQCTDTFCASFATATRPDGGWPERPRTISANVDHGMVNLDVVKGRIVFIELIDRPKDRMRLRMALNI